MRFIFTSFLLIPTVVLAQTSDLFGVEGVFYVILGWIGQLLLAVVVMVFFWGLVKFIGNSSDPKAREEGKKFIVWGLIAFLVLFSLWALVGWIESSLNITPAPVCYVDASGGQICPPMGP